MHPILRGLADSVLSRILDPNPISFRPEHAVGVKTVAAVGAVMHTKTMLPKLLVRNAFLRGCHELTATQRMEHLIVGFGTRHGSTTKIDSLFHCTGNATSVGFPVALVELMRKHQLAGRDHELVVYHNHPKGWLNTYVYDGPMPSVTDRNTMWSQKLNPVQLVKAIIGGGDVLFFVSESGRVQQIKSPAVLQTLEAIQRALPPPPAPGTLPPPPR